MENTQEPQELDRKDLKILAYKDTVSKLQEENADLRVELTAVIQQYNELVKSQENTEPDATEDSTA